VLCRDAAGRIYVHRRTDDKDVYPGMYDMTAGGVLGAGESYLEAARRELAEALGRDQERVLGGVGGLVPVAQQAPAEVVQAVGVAVVDRGEGATVAGRRRPHQLGVVAPVGSRRSSVHSPPAIGPGPGRT